MAKSVASLGEVEIQVLRLVWQHQPCTERQISDLVQQDRTVARTTVLKTLLRLEAKGLLARVPGVGEVESVGASLAFFIIVGLCSLPGAPLFALNRRNADAVENALAVDGQDDLAST